MSAREARSRLRWLLPVLLSPGAALAADGVIELNATCALSAGCLTGDAPGYPITIGEPGSYRLTGNLQVTGNTTAIQVTASDVAIDLAGFLIQGPNNCTGSPTTCSVTGAGSGVAVSSTTTVERLSVEGGSIVGMPDAGVRLGPGGDVRFLRAFSNGTGISIAQGVVASSIVADTGGTGVLSTGSTTVESVVVTNSASDGISLGANSAITGCIATSNAEDGLSAGSTSRIVDSAAFLNGLDGIDAGVGAIVAGVSVRGNGSAGVRVGAGSTVRESVAVGNDAGGFVTGLGSTLTSNAATGNDVAGFAVGLRSFVIGNNSSDNVGAGLLLGDDSSYRENLIASNDGGTVLINGAGTFNAAGGNHCTDAAGNVVACP